jgi:enamine deaminase RidA (YjgF/YER057c/UK114 family)
MKIRNVVITGIMSVVSFTSQSQAVVKHVQSEKGAHADAVWVGDTLYVSGQLPTPITPADPAKGTPSVYGGDTKTQVASAFQKMQVLLQSQGLNLKDVVKVTVFLVGDPKLGNKLDFPGMQASFAQFFGTKEQPNKPARSVVQIAGIAAQGCLVEIEAVAARGSK